MIANGPLLFFSPGRYWMRAAGGAPRDGGWLLAAALAAAVLPAAAVVGGHLGAAAIGHIGRDMAVQRAAVGLVCTVGGALVVAPAMSLVLMRLTRASRAEHGRGLETGAAMGMVWPAWAAGAVLAAPPLLGFGPEPGEALWALAAATAAVRAAREGAVPHLGVRRRWRTHFSVRAVGVFLVLFTAIPIAPAFIARGLLGVAGEISHPPPVPLAWPEPPEPNW